jgi:predicted ATPase/DNA-binding SARP family transcriptional activator
MKLHDLGVVSVDIDGHEQFPPGAQPAMLLAVLAVNVNRRVPVDTLIDALWGEQAAEGAPSTLASHIWRLRGLLEPDRPRGTASRVLVNDTGGYRLVVDPDDIDSVRFERLADEGRDALATDRAERAIRRFDAALALWRGRPFGPGSDEPWAAAAVGRLEELHAQVQERRVDALIAIGRPEQALADLAPMIAAAPLREHLHGLRMLALARVGRVDQALAGFEEFSERMLDEIGIGPGSELQSVQHRLTQRDPALLQSNPLTVARPIGAPSPRPLTPIIGRDDELRRLDALVGTHRLVTVVGAAGSGKSRMAIELSHRIAGRFLDGVWFVDLAEVTESQLAMEVILTALEVTPPAGSSALGALSARIGGRQALVVLDNCDLAGLDELLAVLVGEDADCAVLATSRAAIGIPGETLFDLGPLQVPGPDDERGVAAPAVALFQARLRSVQPTLDLTPSDMRTIADICVNLDGLPLALELAAARARTYSLTEIAEQVARDPAALRAGTRGRPADGSLRDEIDRSYQQLGSAEQALYRTLSVFPGSFTAAAAVAVAGVYLGDEASAVDGIPELVNRCLLIAARSRWAGGASTFRQLAIVRAHGQALLPAVDREELIERRDAWVRSVLGPAFRIRRGEITTYRTLESNEASVRAVLERGLVDGADPSAPLLAAQLTMYWYTRERTSEALRWLELAVRHEAGQLPEVRAAVRAGFAATLAVQARADLASRHTDEVADVLPDVPPAERAFVGDLLALAVAAATATEELEYMRRSFALLTEVAGTADDEDLDLLHAAAGCLVDVASDVDPRRVADAAEVAYDRATTARHVWAAFLAASAAANAYLRLDAPEQGLLWSTRAISLSRTYGARNQASGVETRANLLARAGRLEEAARMYGAARAQAAHLGRRWPVRTLTAELFDEVRHQLPRDEFEATFQAGENLTLVDL